MTVGLIVPGTDNLTLLCTNVHTCKCHRDTVLYKFIGLLLKLLHAVITCCYYMLQNTYIDQMPLKGDKQSHGFASSTLSGFQGWIFFLRLGNFRDCGHN